ncbi:hypothetical protein [Cupriavidus pauculus]|uniref:DUF600 family protein n=1 Tax=Cupriavidus pauculus TaxID=82633 RepID=A0A2N5C5K1_9BURK|nr:hypothetical protein [Cupriavidus pauculus]PLP97467.1 hypothetical protein CYJ10_26905 [Cupriavidus pauculus]
MNDEAPELVIALARHVVGKMQSTFPGWNEVYIRFDAPSDSQCGVRASYAMASSVVLIDTMKHREFIDDIMRIGSQLREALSNNGRKFCVGLLRANSRFSYRMDYEWNDPTRWNITKLNGASGLPEELDMLAPLD